MYGYWNVPDAPQYWPFPDGPDQVTSSNTFTDYKHVIYLFTALQRFQFFDFPH